MAFLNYHSQGSLFERRKGVEEEISKMSIIKCSTHSMEREAGLQIRGQVGKCSLLCGLGRVVANRDAYRDSTDNTNESAWVQGTRKLW